MKATLSHYRPALWRADHEWKTGVQFERGENRSLQVIPTGTWYTDNNGQPITFAQIYNWMGETAREQVFDVLNRVLNDPTLTLKVFAYDFNEPDVAKKEADAGVDGITTNRPGFLREQLSLK